MGRVSYRGQGVWGGYPIGVKVCGEGVLYSSDCVGRVSYRGQGVWGGCPIGVKVCGEGIL